MKNGLSGAIGTGPRTTLHSLLGVRVNSLGMLDVRLVDTPAIGRPQSADGLEGAYLVAYAVAQDVAWLDTSEVWYPDPLLPATPHGICPRQLLRLDAKLTSESDDSQQVLGSRMTVHVVLARGGGWGMSRVRRLS